MSKAEIDTTAPFGSVKEAVVMFGDKLLGCHVYATNLTQMHHSTRIMEYSMSSDELEETKQSLQRAKEESMQMATSLISLQQELQQTKTELQLLKTRQSSESDLRDVEDIKFVQDSTLKTTETEKVKFANNKYVRFSDPPCVARVVLPSHAPEAVLQRHSSLRMKKMKKLVPFIKGIFSKKSGNSQVAFA